MITKMSTWLGRWLLTSLICSLLLTSFATQTTLAGHTLPESERGPGSWYRVQRGDTWYGLSRRFDVPIRELWQVNPGHRHFRNWLFRGERIWIPSPEGECPDDFANYPTEIENRLNTAGFDLSDLETWLQSCGVLNDELGSVGQYALRDVTEVDIVVVIHNTEGVFPAGILLVYHEIEGAYTLVYQPETMERVEVLAVTDLNKNGKRNIVWTDTTCGAHTCFSTLSVDQWNGLEYEDWIIGTPTMATADYTLIDERAPYHGDEIIVEGGSIGSIGAGPHRTWREVYASPVGEPYRQIDELFNPSTCFYHHLLDANQIYDGADLGGSYVPVITVYETLLADGTLEACDFFDTTPDTPDMLRDFARFRLVVSHSVELQAAQATTVRGEMVTPVIQGAADAFLADFGISGDWAQACAATTLYADANPASWDYLQDWGYANPAFTAEWLCYGTAAVSGAVWSDFCPAGGLVPNASCVDAGGGILAGNGLFEGGEEGLPDITVTMYEDTCASVGGDSPSRITHTVAGGWYHFEELESGNYCLEVDLSEGDNPIILIPGSWTEPSTSEDIARKDIVVLPGEDVRNNFFGWDYQFD